MESVIITMTMGNLSNAQLALIHVGISMTVRDPIIEDTYLKTYLEYFFLAVDGEEGTIRMCGAKLPETCSAQDFNGVTLTVCNCQTDNCNKDDGCTCGGAGNATLSLMTLGLVFLVNKFMQ